MAAISLENLIRFKEKLMEKLENLFIKSETKGVPEGIATLDAEGKVPFNQLPDTLEDVVECTSLSDFPEEGQEGKLYIDKTTNFAYRWSGNTYTALSAGLKVGEGHTDAYYGDYGAIAYTHATDANKISEMVSEGFYKISSTREGHIKTLTNVTKTDIVNLGIPSQDTTYGEASKTTAGLLSSNDKRKLDDLANAKIYYATSSSAADEFNKNAECDVSLIGDLSGTLLFLNFENTNAAEADKLTLQVSFNSTSTERLPIKCQQKGELIYLPTKDYLIGGHIYLFECDGTNWILMNAGNGYGKASSIEPGLMSASDKEKLDSPVFEKIFYGNCMTEVDIKDKTVLCPNFKAENLIPGSIIFVYFEKGNTADTAELTLDVNSTGAKPLQCLLRGQIKNLPYTDYILGYQTYMFQYDGTNWMLMNTDTNDDADFMIDESTGELMVTIY